MTKNIRQNYTMTPASTLCPAIFSLAANVRGRMASCLRDSHHHEQAMAVMVRKITPSFIGREPDPSRRRPPSKLPLNSLNCRKIKSGDVSVRRARGLPVSLCWRAAGKCHGSTMTAGPCPESGMRPRSYAGNTRLPNGRSVVHYDGAIHFLSLAAQQIGRAHV